MKAALRQTAYGGPPTRRDRRLAALQLNGLELISSGRGIISFICNAFVVLLVCAGFLAAMLPALIGLVLSLSFLYLVLTLFSQF